MNISFIINNWCIKLLQLLDWQRENSFKFGLLNNQSQLKFNRWIQ